MNFTDLIIRFFDADIGPAPVGCPAFEGNADIEGRAGSAVSTAYCAKK
jgi:hypothetical protein